MRGDKCKNFEKCGSLIEDDKRSPFCVACRSLMGRRSKRKGSANELRFSKYLNEQFQKYGFPYIARRTPRSGGIQDFEPSDILFKFLPQESTFGKIHWENKNCAVWDIPGWMEYAVKKERDTGRNRMPTLIIRKPNEHEEYAVMRMEDYISILIDLEAYKTK